MMIPVYILPLAGIIFLIADAVMIKMDKKKRLKFHGQVTGAVCFLLSILSFIIFFTVMAHFNVKEAEVVKRIISDTCDTKDVVLISQDKKDAETVFNKDAYLKAKGDDESAFIYTDQFLNKRTVPLTDVATAYTDGEMSEDKIKITRAFCKESNGIFMKWGILYEIYFGTV